MTLIDDCSFPPATGPAGPISPVWRIVVGSAADAFDATGRATLARVRAAGFHGIGRVRAATCYFLSGRLDRDVVEAIAAELLCDPVTQRCSVAPARIPEQAPTQSCAIEVYLRPGVMDPVALSARGAIGEFLAVRCPAARIGEVRTARRFEIDGATSADELARIASGVLANPVIETICIDGLGRSDPRPNPFPAAPRHEGGRRCVSLRDSDDSALERLSRGGHLFLSLAEMRAIRQHFAAAGREPTDLELETFAQTWSEHCVHKTLKSDIRYRGPAMGLESLTVLAARPVQLHYRNLLKSTIVRATHTLARDWCLSVFTDNAGIVAFDDAHGIAFKVETHNHPSAIEPYGGAATGVGGCIRDILGCGLGAAPVASTDVFCVAPPDFDAQHLPVGVLHPRRVLSGVVAGVRDYGNRMGIPTVNGAIYFDERYLANPLVFCGCVGLIPRDRIQKRARPGDWIVLAGGRTGRDGIHGATFSSAELTDTHADEFSHAVQIGNPIEEKKLLDALLRARGGPTSASAAGIPPARTAGILPACHDCLFSAVTDCGAGGLSSAVGEMAADIGAVVDLELVPLKYEGLRYDEIWISEAQERMVFAVPPQSLSAFLNVFAEEEVEATVIGRFAEDHTLRLRYRGESVGEIDLSFLHHGRPCTERQAEWLPSWNAVRPRSVPRSGRRLEPQARGHAANDCGEAMPPGTRHSPPAAEALGTQHPRAGGNGRFAAQLLSTLAHPNVASKERVVRVYDHEVQGGSVVKPLCGLGAGPADAAVLRPRFDSYRGIALGAGLAPHLSDYDPYLMAVAAVDEALRNVICVGADPARTAILDNFCWGGVDDPNSLGALVRACQGAHDAAVAYGLPFISGKDSLNNQFTQSAAEARRCGLPERLSIPGTLLISALGLIGDVRRCVTSDLKRAGNKIVLAARPADRHGLGDAQALHTVVAEAIGSGNIAAAHDVSDGGLASALAEMCIAGRLGGRVDTAALGAPDGIEETLFGEPLTSYLLELRGEMGEWPTIPARWTIIGHVTDEPRLRINQRETVMIDLPVAQLQAAWSAGLELSAEF